MAFIPGLSMNRLVILSMVGGKISLQCLWHCYRVSFNMWHYFLEVKLAVQMSFGFIWFLQYLSSCLSPLTLNPYSFQTHVLPLGFAKVYFLFPLQLTQRILRFTSGKWCLVYKMDRQQSSGITSLEKRKWNEHSKTGADRVLGPTPPWWTALSDWQGLSASYESAFCCYFKKS